MHTEMRQILGWGFDLDKSDKQANALRAMPSWMSAERAYKTCHEKTCLLGFATRLD